MLHISCSILTETSSRSSTIDANVRDIYDVLLLDERQHDDAESHESVELTAQKSVTASDVIIR